MGNKLFGVNISKLIKDNIGPGVLDATLTVVTNTGINAADPTGAPTTSSTPHACKGFIDSQGRRAMDGTLIQDGTVVIVLIGDTINGGATAPTTADTISILGKSYSIETVDADPAEAAYTMVCRPR